MIQGFARSNPKLQRREAYRRESVGGRTGLTTVLSNVSDITGEAELVSIATVQLRGNSNSVLFLIGVSPERENSTYSATFQRVRQSLQISDR